MFFPIRELTPYHKQWTIKARVTAKSTVRTFNRMGQTPSEGKVFSIDMIDKDGGEIRCSFFNESATKFLPILEQGKVYTFSKGQVRVANRQYNQCNHDYELSFGMEAKIETQDDDNEITAEVTFNCVEVRSVRTRGLPCLVDVIGVVTEVQDVRTWTKEGKSFSKYQFTVADESETGLEISMFGETAKKSPPEKLRGGTVVVALKGITVKAFNGGRSGVLNDSGALMVDPATPQLTEKTKALKTWWDTVGHKKSMASMAGTAGGSNRPNTKVVTMKEVVEDVEGNISVEPVFSEVYCRMSAVITARRGEDNVAIWYPACQEEANREALPGSVQPLCNKKCDQGNHCPQHGLTSKIKLRWMARTVFQDYSDFQYMQLFDDDMTKVCGKTAEECEKLAPAERTTWLEALGWQKPFKLRLKTTQEEFLGELRARSRVLQIDSVSLVERGREMMKEISEMQAGKVA